MKNVIKNVVKIIVNAGFPQRCRGCGEVGNFLCDCCKKYISENMQAQRIEAEGVFDRAEFLGFRDEILGEMVEECKYGPTRGLAAEIAKVIYKGYFKETSGTILVPMPTSRKHVRERGFDHMDLVCREIERLSGGQVRRVRLLERAKDTVQVGASSEVRKKQAKEAVKMNPKYLGGDGQVPQEFRRAKVILVDDVWTTGASMVEAGKILKEAGVGSFGDGSLLAVAITKNRPRRKPVLRQGEID